MNKVKLSKGFSDRNVSAGKISFGLHWNNLLKAKIHLAQDFRRIRRTPSIVGINNTIELFTDSETAKQKANISKYILEGLVSLRKAVNPGHLKWHKDGIT